MVKKILFGHITLWVAIHLLGCSNNNCLQSAGPKVSHTIEFNPVSTIRIKSNFTIKMIPDTCNFVEIIAAKTLLEHTNIVIQNNTLHCSNNFECAAFKKYETVQLNIHFSNLDTLIIEDACAISNTIPFENNLTVYMNAFMVDMNLNLQNERFTLKTINKAGGNIILQGKSHYCSIINKYTAMVNAKKLITHSMHIDNGSIQDVTIHVTDSLHARTRKTGKILYQGNPYYINLSNTNSSLVEAIPK